MASSRPGHNLIENEFWYAGAISEKKTEQVLSEKSKAGTFLVRDSLLPEADYVLSVNTGKDIWHYDVTVMPNNECIFNDYSFPSLPEAIEFYMENRLGSVFLREPKAPIVTPSKISKSAAPVIRRAVSGSAVQPRTSALSSSKTKSHNTHNNGIDLKFSDHAWLQGQDGSQAGYSPVLSHSRQSSSIIDEVKSQGSSVRSQTSEVDSSYILPSNNIESVYIKPEDNDGSADTNANSSDKTPQVQTKNHDHTEFCVTNFDSNSETKLSEASSNSSNEHDSSRNPDKPKVVKPSNPSEKANELKQLPSIGEKMLELEKKSRGESDSKPARPKSPAPPKVPKRISSIPSLPKSEPEPEPKNDTAKTAVPTPKKLSIPEMFLEKPSDEQKTPTQQRNVPNRIEIPISLEVMPPPPPLSTHPGLSAKMKEEEEKDKLQPQMAKKRKSGISIKIKKRNSKREKRQSLTEEPVVLGSEGSSKLTSPTQEQPMSPRRIPGVPTPALSPGAAGGDGGELENKFKFITKQKWNTDTFDTNPSNETLKSEQQSDAFVSTFGHASPSKPPKESSSQRPPSVTQAPPSASPATSPVKKETINSSKLIDEVNAPKEVSTFISNKKTTQPPVSKPKQEEESTPIKLTAASNPSHSRSGSRISESEANGVSNESNASSHENGIENKLSRENGINANSHPATSHTEQNSIGNLVPGAKQPYAPQRSPILGVTFPSAKSSKHQMPPGFMLVAPTQPLPPLSTSQRRLVSTDQHDGEPRNSGKQVTLSPGAPGPMNTKRGEGGIKKRKSLKFRNK